MAEVTLKVELDTSECLELIEKHKREFRERITVQSVMDYLCQNEERIKCQLGDVNEYRLAEVLIEYGESIAG